MPPKVLLGPEHWVALLDAVWKEVDRQPHPPRGALGQLWRILADAESSSRKRFIVEVEKHAVY
jgi:hypothetical protein